MAGEPVGAEARVGVPSMLCCLSIGSCKDRIGDGSSAAAEGCSYPPGTGAGL